jgi:hypothetical protein
MVADRRARIYKGLYEHLDVGLVRIHNQFL